MRQDVNGWLRARKAEAGYAAKYKESSSDAHPDDEMPMTSNHGLNAAWLAGNNTRAASTAQRTWGAIASSPEWADWLRDKTADDSIFSVVSFEDRSAEKLVVRGDTLTAYVPLNDVLAAAEARTLPRYMAELFGRIYSKWADKRRWPPPPTVPIDVEKDLPSRLP